MFLDKKSFSSDNEVSEWQLHIHTAYAMKQDVVAQYLPDLVEANMVIIFCNHKLSKDGGRKIAIISRVSSTLKFYVDRYYDSNINFLIRVDYDIWKRLTDHRRKAVIHHELKHVKGEWDEDNQELKRSKSTGEIIWHLVPHDKEEFDEVEQIYGVGWNCILMEDLSEKKKEDGGGE